MSSVVRKSSRSRPAAPLTQQLSPGGAESLVGKLASEMARRWEAGERPGVEEFLSRHPELGCQPEAIIRLIYEEICLRQESGQETASMEVVQRFPQWREQLEDILCRPIPRAWATPRFPDLGETLGGFRLVAELGRGLRGRVFLASQAALADRPVVLKMTTCDGGEHLSLARLQHTHIVPLYSVQDFVESNLRILCMPYFGGATLAQIQEGLQGRALSGLTGQDLLNSLDQLQPPSSTPIAARSPVRQILGQLSYTRSICWIGICLAEALEYAHERGLVHLDLKPSNVLLAADGQPMLLDFHLAQQPLRPESEPPTWLGGTPAYMSPEQRAAITAMRDRRPVPTPVDGRSDIYSLGVLLYEALGGSLPKPGSEVSAGLRLLQPRNSQMTPGLADLIGKCLQPNPENRYRRAAALALDLRRYLSDLPLVGAGNRSWTERWQKWRRRQPAALALYGLSLAVLIAAIGGGLQLQHRYGDAQQALEAGRKQIAQGDFESASRTLALGTHLLEMIPFSHQLQEDLAADLRVSREKQLVRDFRRVADQVRIRSMADSLNRRELSDLEASCREAWNSLHLISARLSNLEPEEQQRVQNDFLDLAILGASLRVQLAVTSEKSQAHEAALRLLEDAEAVFGPSSILCFEQKVHAEALGWADAAQRATTQCAALPPKTSWEHCLRGRSLLDSGKAEEAMNEFKQAVRLDTGGLWPNYYLGVCAHRLGRSKDALTAFSVCVGATGQAATHETQAHILFNRGLAYAATGAPSEAMEDYTRALELLPTLGQAALNRGLLHFQARHYGEALDDLDRALENGAAPVLVHYNRALIYNAQNHRRDALASAQQALQYDPSHKEAQALLKQLSRQP
jgi:eukaryotic-like serine/threonine-protein kinase